MTVSDIPDIITGLIPIALILSVITGIFDRNTEKKKKALIKSIESNYSFKYIDLNKFKNFSEASGQIADLSDINVNLLHTYSGKYMQTAYCLKGNYKDLDIVILALKGGKGSILLSYIVPIRSNSLEISISNTSIFFPGFSYRMNPIDLKGLNMKKNSSVLTSNQDIAKKIINQCSDRINDLLLVQSSIHIKDSLLILNTGEFSYKPQYFDNIINILFQINEIVNGYKEGEI
jgi:hypothetical protein